MLDTLKMKFAIVFAAILAVAAAASQPTLSEGIPADNTVVAVDDVITGADYTLAALLKGGVTGLSEHSTNGVKNVAFTDAGFLVGLPSNVHAVLIGMFDSIISGCKC